MFDFSNILSRIKTLKKAQGFTNATLAQASGVPKSTVDKILAGLIKDPSIVTIIKISHALGETVDFILDCDLDIEQNSFSKSDEAYTTDEKQLINNYRKLNTSGKEKASDYMEDLTTMEKYTASEELQGKLG